MKAFTFIDYREEINIAGQTFTIDTSTDMGDKVKAHTQEEALLAAAVGSGKKDKAELIDKLKADINDILGDGACDRIFAGRAPSVPDASDVMLYIVDFIVYHSNRRRDERMKNTAFSENERNIHVMKNGQQG